MTTTRVFIVGSPGEGKSSHARAITRGAKRRISLDPSLDWGRHKIRRATSLKSLSAIIAANYRGGFDVTYTPPVGQEAEALHRISQLVMAYQKNLWQRSDANEITFVIDEMSEAYSNAHSNMSALGGFRTLVTQSRHFGVSIVGATQLPSLVAAKFRSMCEERYFFRVHDANDVDTVLRTLGREHVAAYKALPKFHCLAMRSGVVTAEKGQK